MGIKDLAQTAMAPAQWLALLTAPQSINLPIIEVQRGIILPHLSSEDLESKLCISAWTPGSSCCVNLTSLLPNPGLPEHRVQGRAHLPCSFSGWGLGLYVSQGSADTDGQAPNTLEEPRAWSMPSNCTGEAEPRGRWLPQATAVRVGEAVICLVPLVPQPSGKHFSGFLAGVSLPGACENASAV